MWKEYKESSRIFNWGREVGEGNLNLEELKVGALLRIADSLENMEQPYKDLLKTIEYYKKFGEENKKLKRSISGLKGYIKTTKSKWTRIK